MAWSSVYLVHAYNVNTFAAFSTVGSVGSSWRSGHAATHLNCSCCERLHLTRFDVGIHWFNQYLNRRFLGIPLPVQLMKAISAVAIAGSLTRAETASAGIFVAVVILVFSVTGPLKWFTRVVPIPVIKGIQVRAGLSLVLSAGSSMLGTVGWISPNWADNLLWAIAAFLLLLATPFITHSPYALALVVLGVTFALLPLLAAEHQRMLYFGIWCPLILVPSTRDLQVGAIDAGLGQLPLTTLNSIVAVAHLSADLIPVVPGPSNTELGFSVAAMNLVGC